MNQWEELYNSGGAFVPDIGNPVPYAREFADILEKKIGVSGKKILDVGCGPGTLGMGLEAAGAKVIGIDNNPTAVDMAKKRISDASIGNAMELPFSADEFDFTISGGLLEHFTDDEILIILSEKIRVSRDCIVTVIPNPEDIVYRAWKQRLERAGDWPYGEERMLDIPYYYSRVGITSIWSTAFNLRQTLQLLNTFEDAASLKNEIATMISLEETTGLGYAKMYIGGLR